MVEPAEIPQSPDIHFRESDVEFLKQQARIWLESVLNERYNEDTSLADLLADGEILHRVSLRIRTLLQNHSDGEPASPKSLFPEASFYGKHSGKYLPYSNVDSFLRVCQKLGLTGVDLFSPPDVVEKKDIRRVCLCIRALSKKARARNLEVPNFDYVTHTISMPTEMVGGLRDSLRQASSQPSPRSVDNRETLEKVQFSPLSTRRPVDSDVSTRAASPHAPDPQDKGSPCAATSDEDGVLESVSAMSENTPGTPDQSLSESHQTIASDEHDAVDSSSARIEKVCDASAQPSIEDDSGFLSGSRSAALFPDEECATQRSPFEAHSPKDAQAMHVNTSPLSGDQSSSKAIGTLGMHHKSQHDTQYDSKHKVLSEKPTGRNMMDGKGRKKGNLVALLAAAAALLGAVLIVRARSPSVYEVKEGDTLSKISRKTGKSSWKELVDLNPGILNPDLIYPGEKLRLRA